MTTADLLLDIDDLTLELGDPGTVSRPLRGVSVQVRANEIVGVVGETGCGKTLTGLAALGLLPVGGRPGGRVDLLGQDVLSMTRAQVHAIRGRRVAMIFQNPASAFNPVNTIGTSFLRVIRTHLPGTRRAAIARAREYLAAAELTDTARILASYPHQLSGGMLQRAMIALALSCEPDLVIADEATTALDVTVARQVLRLLLRLQRERGFGVLFVTHNLAEAYDLCDRVYVLYAGRVVESGVTTDVFERPAHPYTRALLAALPSVDRRGTRLEAIPGAVPDPLHEIVGCAFADRCPHVQQLCRDAAPESRPVENSTHEVACHFAGDRP